ncbi:hypothetical protein EX30DRAFT_371643 [Ascodesmis nigricans]|uniref:Uncharacterized protein n=1 Tax=Ascodesmis nigricans TaxID=341454 RepID=A0A4S2MX84_9PEZI|nr:hypothetical protein EX30DRAFT_371643 [Ascodesmis nigricans]
MLLLTFLLALIAFSGLPVHSAPQAASSPQDEVAGNADTDRGRVFTTFVSTTSTFTRIIRSTITASQCTPAEDRVLSRRNHPAEINDGVQVAGELIATQQPDSTEQQVTTTLGHEGYNYKNLLARFLLPRVPQQPSIRTVNTGNLFSRT